MFKIINRKVSFNHYFRGRASTGFLKIDLENKNVSGSTENFLFLHEKKGVFIYLFIYLFILFILYLKVDKIQIHKAVYIKYSYVELQYIR